MKYRTLEFIGSLILAGVAAAMFTKAHAGPVDDCLAYAKFAQTLDIDFDNGRSLEAVVQDIMSVNGPPHLEETLVRMAINSYKYHRGITPAEAYALTFDVCMRGSK